MKTPVPFSRLGLLFLCSLTAPPIEAQTSPVGSTAVALKRLTIEDLLNLEVVAVSRHPEKASESASAIRVITEEEIRRSGAATLPQALRLASNLQTAQLSSSYWTIGARGLNTTTTTSNKLLVMIDGRTVYSPLVSGTYWDQRDVFLPDIDRIEVVSGPGGSAWGANAVNGVINIVSKRAADTQGSLVYAGAGLEERALAGARYGGTVAGGHYRVYAKYLDYDGALRSNGTDARNRWVFSQTGFRSDTPVFAQGELTLLGDLYTGWIQQPTSARGEFDGGDLELRLRTPVSADSTLTVQTFYDSARRGAPTTVADRIDTLDLDVQHEWRLGRSDHRLVWGAGHRKSRDSVRNLATQAIIPTRFTHELTWGFVHTEAVLVPQRLRAIVGARVEHNNYSGSDFQPNARLAWSVNARQMLWTAVSRAVRTPSRFDRDIYVPAQPPYVAAGGPGFGSEKLLAYELGWKSRLSDRGFLTVSGFVNRYTGLRTLEQPVPLTFANGLDARTYGVETMVQHEFSPRFSGSLGYTWFKSDFRLKSWSRDLNNGQVEIADPENQAQLHLSFTPSRSWEFDLGARYVGATPTLFARVVSPLPAYSELDARLAWNRGRGLEVALIGTNLLDRAHPEAGPANNRREIERSVHGRVTWRY